MRVRVPVSLYIIPSYTILFLTLHPSHRKCVALQLTAIKYFSSQRQNSAHEINSIEIGGNEKTVCDFHFTVYISDSDCSSLKQSG